MFTCRFSASANCTLSNHIRSLSLDVKSLLQSLSLDRDTFFPSFAPFFGVWSIPLGNEASIRVGGSVDNNVISA